MQAALAVVCALDRCGAMKWDHRAGFRRANKSPSPTSLFGPAPREIYWTIAGSTSVSRSRDAMAGQSGNSDAAHHIAIVRDSD